MELSAIFHIDTVEIGVKMHIIMIPRYIEKDIKKFIASKKEPNILFIWGPRRSGKTTILEKISKDLKIPKFNFDLISDRGKFTAYQDVLEKIADEHKIILIDEVQNYPEATVSLKILADIYKTKTIAAGSSELRQKGAKEFDSLAGRFDKIYCLPLTIKEILDNIKIKKYDKTEYSDQLLEKLQIFGSYTEVYYTSGSSEQNKIRKLEKIIDTYVLKDIIDIYNLKDSKLAKDILTKIALQIGSEVSTRELATSLQANEGTVTSYIEIFIKNYILIPLPSFKTNARRAVSENRKLYFYDLGIRNALVRDFRETALRPDAGGVWENLIISELEKTKKNNKLLQNHYFYREYGGREIDIVVEDYKKNYTCIEIKKKRGGVKKIFPLPHSSELVNKSNLVTFFTSPPFLPNALR